MAKDTKKAKPTDKPAPETKMSKKALIQECRQGNKKACQELKNQNKSK